MDKKISILWRLLFNEDLEEIPDPNKPENTAHFNALKKVERDQLERFLNGSGKVLVDRWQKRIKKNILTILSNPDKSCNCINCMLLRETRLLLEFIYEGQDILK
jgi:hypothetical protein